MVFEIAEIKIKPDAAEQFVAAVKEAMPLFQRAKGCGSMQLQRSEEDPNEYRLVVDWQTLENHTVDFRNSADFSEWRRLAGPYFAEPPKVRHVSTVFQGF